MRHGCALLFMVALSGCSESAPSAPSRALAPARAEQVEEPVARPSRPTPAFLPHDQGRCARAYTLISETCVHRYYAQSPPAELEQALAAYKRGAAPPMLGLAPARAREPEPVRRPLDPGALVKRDATEAEGGSAKERRLAELDLMLEAAREKLRERDEAAKARHVDNAPRRAASKDEAPRNAALTPGAPAGASDPASARLHELSQLASQLGSEQLRALSTELAQSGIDTSALDQAVRGEQGSEAP